MYVFKLTNALVGESQPEETGLTGACKTTGRVDANPEIRITAVATQGTFVYVLVLEKKAVRYVHPKQQIRARKRVPYAFIPISPQEKKT